MADKGYKLGTWIEHWGNGKIAKNVTFILTQDCNLACSYCYMTGKNHQSKMSWEVAKDTVDYLLRTDFPEDRVVWEFLGGEPFLEVELMDRICDYIKMQTYLLNHKWKEQYMFSLSTNGVLYHLPAVQRFIQKHRDHLSVTISIDGTKEKHDMHRRFPNGKGSYDIVAENVQRWLQQFPLAATKATFASDDLPYLKESIIHLWNLGLTKVPANVVFEDVWKEGDDAILEQQLRELADYALEHDLWQTHVCHFFSDLAGSPLAPEQLGRNWCGAGHHMLAVDHQGKIYPCVRFMDYSLNNRKSIVFGDVYEGIDPDRMRPFAALDIPSQSPAECLECEVAGHCAWCQGYNYDMAETDTIYQRATFICKMHKARVRANDYYFSRLARLKNERQPRRHDRTLFFILADDSVRVCGYENRPDGGSRMSPEVFRKGLEFAAHNFYHSVLLQPTAGELYELPDGFAGWHAVPAARTPEQHADLVVYDNSVSHLRETPVALLVVDRQNLGRLEEFARQVIPWSERTVLVLNGIGEFTADEFQLYESQLAAISHLVEEWIAGGRKREFSVLTDRLWLDQMDNCQAGVKTFAVAPNGLLYICPAFYYADPDSAVGSLETGVDPKKVELCKLTRAPLCAKCDALHCKRCVFDNRRRTGELNTPAQSQCAAAHVELRQTAPLRDRLEALGLDNLCAPITVTSLDPLDRSYTARR